MSPDAKVRRKGIEANKAALDCCQPAAAEILAGPYIPPWATLAAPARRRTNGIGPSTA